VYPAFEVTPDMEKLDNVVKKKREPATEDLVYRGRTKNTAENQ